MQKLIHYDQVGFIQREARDGTIRTNDVIYQIHNDQKEICLLSTDAKKAFNRVNWQFLFQKLEENGLGVKMNFWIRGLYTLPEAQIRTNGVLPEKFPIKKGTRQGCPLSPLLFILTLEPFLRTVRKYKGGGYREN